MLTYQLLFCWFLLIFLLAPGIVLAQDDALAISESADIVKTDQERLNAIARQIASKKQELIELRLTRRVLPIGEDDTQIKSDIAAAQAGLELLKTAFSQLATRGVAFEASTDGQTKAYKWQDELVQVIRPVLGGLKDLTEKPRRIEEARTKILMLTEKQEQATQAISALSRAAVDSLTPDAGAQLAVVKAQWLERQSNAVNEIEVARIRLQTLEAKTFDYHELIVDPIKAFLIGRGLTLLIAMGTALVVWNVLSKAFKPVTRRFLVDLKRSERRTRERTLAYLFRGFAFIIVILSVLVIFYVRSDMLLLVLSVFVMVGLAMMMQKFVPKYLAELRILVNAGAVREGERLIFQSLPMEVTSIKTFAILRNPSLEGIVRLPLEQLQDLISRPFGEEPWFPCEEGDTLLLRDGSIANVMRQTLEVVQLRIAGTTIDFPTAEFAQTSPKNLSRDGYVLPITFGIDYQHQAICLTDIPPVLNETVKHALENSTVAPFVNSSSVSFKEAATNSLDYLILIYMSGEAASAYYAIGRLVQHALVDVCNQREWGIPFSQLTVHLNPELLPAAELSS